MVKITDEVRAHARRLAGGRCECTGDRCRHHLRGARCKRGLRGKGWKVFWRSEAEGITRDNISAWCLECFQNNFTVPTSLVTLLRSDIFGYARLASENRRRALTLMSVLKDTADRIGQERQGRLVDTSTDEVCLEFDHAARAVEAALQLQPRFHEGALKLNLPTPDLCCGLHRGEIVRSRAGDVYGDAVDLSEEVKRIADPGLVVVSGTVAEELGTLVTLEDLGDRPLGGSGELLHCWVVRG